MKDKEPKQRIRTNEEESAGCSKVDEALRESEDRFRALFENAMDAIMVTDPSGGGRVLAANPAACRMLGYNLEEFLLLDKEAIVDTSDPNLAALIKQRDEQGHASTQLTYKRKNGSRFTGDVTSAFFQNRKGNLREVAVIRDITARKQTEEELRRKRDELELRVMERTAELECKNRELSALNQELEEFAAVASHDLQEPLRKIQMFGEMLGRYKDLLDKQGIDYLSRMQDGARRMGTLLSALLDYSRVKTRSEDFHPVDLNEVLSEAISNVEYWLRKNNGKIQVEDLPSLESDGQQMIRLFQNLLSNGLKYHKPEVPPVVRVRAVKATDRCQLFVDDNGIGFDEKYLAQIFKPFERLHGKSSTYTGVGMGLAICRKIVERHGGTITARSIPGKGSSFIVTLPVKQIPYGRSR